MGLKQAVYGPAACGRAVWETCRRTCFSAPQALFLTPHPPRTCLPSAQLQSIRETVLQTKERTSTWPTSPRGGPASLAIRPQPLGRTEGIACDISLHLPALRVCVPTTSTGVRPAEVSSRAPQQHVLERSSPATGDASTRESGPTSLGRRTDATEQCS